MQNTGLDESQSGINIVRININNVRYADVTTLREESEEELKSLLMKVKKESEKASLKLNIQKTAQHFMANRWGKKWKQWQILFSWAPKITTDGDCSHEIKRCLLLERNIVTKLDSTLKSIDITLLTKVNLVKAMVFLVVMYKCENWAKKDAEHKRNDAFELWCWRRLLKVPWTARRSNQSI